MSRTLDLEKRKLEIIAAGMHVLYKQGFCNLRISDVARQAGVSAGLICHHFETKQGLLIAIMDHAVTAYEAQSQEVLKQGGTASQQIHALANVALSLDQANPELSAACLALYYLASADRSFYDILARYQQVNFENVRNALRTKLDQDEANTKARLIVALLDGVWLQHAVPSETVTLAGARQLATELISVVISATPTMRRFIG